MICLEAQYFKINKILLQATALWPFAQSNLDQVHFIIFFSIVLSIPIFQLTIFLTTESISENIVQNSACVFPFILVIVLYGTYRCYRDILKDLLLELHHICKGLKDANEIAIIEKYGYFGKRYTVFLIGISMFSGCIVILSQISPIVLDIIFPINGSRVRDLLIIAEYFFEDDLYFILLIIYTNIALGIAVSSVITVMSIQFTYLQLTCGMCTIASYDRCIIYSYRIEHATEIYIPQNMNLKIDHLICKQIIFAINIHRKALTLSELLITNFAVMYFCVTLMSVVILSLNMFQVFQVIESANIMKTVIPAISANIIIVCIFTATYGGQRVTDHANQIYIAAYNIDWYMYSIYIQRIILYLLQRAIKRFYLICGGLVIASLECFATLLKAAASYFTVMYSTV